MIAQDGVYRGDCGQGEIEILQPIEVFQNQYVTFYNDRVKFPSGVEGSYIRMHYHAPYSVCILPLTADGRVAAIRTFRHGIRGWGLELPKGFGNEGETPLEAAKRELREETGMVSDDWVDIGVLFESPALSADQLHCFIARGCTVQGALYLDAEEPSMTVSLIDPAAYDLKKGNSYVDVVTELLLLKYCRH